MAQMSARGADSSDARFIGDLSVRFERAAERRGVERVHLSLAGRSIALEFAGPALRHALTSAFTHRAKRDEGSVAERADFTIRCWDTQSTGVPPPPPPAQALLERGFDRGETGRLRRTYCAVSGTLQSYDLEQPCAYYWMRDARQAPPWELAAPFRGLLAGWAASWGGVLAHAAVVGRAGKGVLLAGSSGAGKSTSSLACVGAGLRFLGDDCALLDDTEPATAHSVYRTAKVDPRLLEARLSALRAFETSHARDRNKATLAFPASSEVLLRQCRVVAIVTQALAGSTPVGEDGALKSQSSLEPVSPARALAALAPSTLLQMPGAGQATLERLAQLVASVPCFSLQAGSDLGALAAMLAELVA